jgi:hypothetical protein
VAISSNEQPCKDTSIMNNVTPPKETNKALITDPEEIRDL